MVETVKVISASNPNAWEHGIVYYDMVFERNGEPFPCSWGTKGGEPQPGEEIEGEFTQKGDGSWKFTKGSKDKPSPSQGGGKRDWKPREPRSQYDPEDMARQTRSAAQDRALKAMSLTPLGEGEKWSEGAFKEEIERWTAWFEDHVLEAGQAALQGAGGASGPGSGSQGTAPEQQPAAVDLSECEQALNTAGMMGVPGRKVAEFMVTQLPPERCAKAARNLTGQDIELQRNTLKALKSNTEEWAGSLPLDNPGNDIPFRHSEYGPVFGERQRWRF